MKNDSFNDIEYFIYGMAFGGPANKFSTTGEQYGSAYSLYGKQNAPNAYSQATVKQQGSSPVKSITPQTSLPADNVYGEAVVTLLRSWLNRQVTYCQGYPARLNENTYDCSSLVCRAYYDVFTSAGLTDIAALFAVKSGNTWTKSGNTDSLANIFQKYSILIAVNTYDLNKLLPGDVILFGSKNYGLEYRQGTSKDDSYWWEHFMHVYHAAVYTGNNKRIDITNSKSSSSPSTSGIKEVTLNSGGYGYDTIRLIGRPNLLPYNSTTFSISNNDLFKFTNTLDNRTVTNLTVSDDYRRIID